MFEPRDIGEDGKVKGTPLVNHLYLKKRAKVILTHNIDVADGLNNGAKGTVLDFVKGEDGSVTHVIIEFENPKAGEALRKSQGNHRF